MTELSYAAMQRCLLFLLMSIPFTHAARAEDATFESARRKTHLIELFTSEGCSSCPPAEEWLSRLKNDPRLWREFVPIAFHVDYWDRLGWSDPLASKAWTARQYAYSALWQSTSVYTPGFVLNGREWRDRKIPEKAREEPGILKIVVKNNESVIASFAPTAKTTRAYEVHVARLGFDLNIHVKAGENSGRNLLHDFVVLSLTNEALDSESKEVRLAPSAVPSVASAREAMAAWVTERGQVEPLQAVGGWLR